MTKHDDIKFTAEACGLRWAAQADGKGTRRYKFFRASDGAVTFDEPGELATCYGASDAIEWLRGFKAARELTRAQETEAIVAYLHVECSRSASPPPEPATLQHFVDRTAAGIEEGRHRRPRLEVIAGP